MLVPIGRRSRHARVLVVVQFVLANLERSASRRINCVFPAAFPEKVDDFRDKAGSAIDHDESFAVDRIDRLRQLRGLGTAFVRESPGTTLIISHFRCNCRDVRFGVAPQRCHSRYACEYRSSVVQVCRFAQLATVEHQPLIAGLRDRNHTTALFLAEAHQLDGIVRSAFFARLSDGTGEMNGEY